MGHRNESSDRDATPDVHQPDLDGNSPVQYPDSAVAVVGVACRFAGADSVEQLWQILESGTTQCVEIPKHRFPDSRFERRPFKMNFRASVMNDLDAFDHKFFNVPSREASFRDPQQRISLEVTYQALESAGYFAQEITEEQRDMGCYFATSMNEYRENVITHAPSAFSLTGSIRPFIAGQINHYFGFTGPALMLDAACAASGATVHVACRAVANGECKSAIAGATNVFISPETFQDLAAGHFTSPTGQSKPFDAAADGYGRGEGVAAIVLKRLSDALKEGDVIKGVISATATNQCANENPITIPHAPTQSVLYRKALQLAHLDVDRIGYVEAHGTGTRVGDPIEAESICSVFGDPSRRRVAKTYLGSLKSSIGHTEASSGISGLIKVMLMIEKRLIPRQALFNSLHPDIPSLEPYGLEIPTDNIPWTSKYRAGCVNNYGASGSNAVMILTQPPHPAKSEPAPQIHTYPVSITAFSDTSLKSYCSALLEFIMKPQASDSLALDVSYHLSRRRNPELPFFVTASISSLQELKELLVSAQSGAPRKSECSKCPTVLFFGGQTGKPASVARELYESCAIFRKHLNDCEESLHILGHPSMFPTIFESHTSEPSVLAHSKLFSVQYASAKSWIDCGVQPARLVGHSFGQLTALCVSGALSLHDALHLITNRARLIDAMWGSDTGSMIAVEATQDELSDLLAQYPDHALETACYNGAHSFVLAGTTASVNSMEDTLKAGSYRFKRLQVPNAFHSPLTEPLINPLEKIAEELDLQEPKISLETCSEGSTWTSVEPSLIASHIRKPVYFHQAVQRINKQLGPCVWIEAGMGGNESLLRRALEPQASSHDIKSLKLDASSSLKSLAELTADLWRLNLKIQFWPFHQDQRHHYQVLNLPPYQFDKTRHWLEWKELDVQPVTDAPLTPEQNLFIHLVRKTKDGGEFQINTQYESWRAICAENRILGTSTCPVSLLQDLLSEAIETVEGASAQKTCLYRVQHLKMPAPIPAETDNKLSLEISRASSPHSWTFRLSRASNVRYELASGVVYAGETRSQSDFIRFERLVDTARIRDLRNDARADSIRGRALYKSHADLFHVPKRSQVIWEISAKGNEAAASLISLSDSALTAVESLIQIPLICLNSLHERPYDYVFINTAVGDAHVRGPASSASTEGSCSVYLRFFELEEPEPSCDVFVFDAQSGRLSAIVLDAGFARVQVKSLHQSLDGITTASHQPGPSEVSKPNEGYAPAAPDPEPTLHDDESMQSDSLPDLTQALFDVLVRIADVDANELHGDTLIADLGIDSLMGMEVADEINKFFAVDIDTAEFAIAEDINVLCQLVADRATGFSYNSGASSGSPSPATADSGVTASSSNTEISDGGEGLKAGCGLPMSRESASTVLTAAFKAFDDIRADFDLLARETGCDTFWSEVHPIQTRLIEAYIFEAFASLGCDFVSFKAGEVVPTIPHKPEHDKLLKQLMLVLRDDGLIFQFGNDWLRSDKPISGHSSSTVLFNQIQAQFPKWAPEHELLHVAGSNLAGHLDGTQSSLKLLFGTPERRKLMADQYLIAPIQSSVSRQLANLITKSFSSQTFNGPLRILEVGGGTCGTTLYALDAFAKAGVPVEYTFTDISSSFIVSAKSKLKDYKSVKYQTLDVSKVPPAEFQGKYDMIIATNVIHATPDAGKSAGNVRQMLRPGGVLAMVEYTCIYAAIDVIFGQLDGWWLFDDGRSHATMDEHQWDATLKRAGYDRVDWTGSKTRESEIMRIFLAC